MIYHPLCDPLFEFCQGKSKSQSPFPRPFAHRAAPISVSTALGHASVNAVKATAGGWPTVSSASLTFPLHSHMSSARREGNEYHFKKSLVWLGRGSNPRPTGCEADTLPLRHHSGLSRYQLSLFHDQLSLSLYFIMRTFKLFTIILSHDCDLAKQV